MATQSTSASVSTGNCEFCKAEIAKSKMTQHLKNCKERRATIAAQEKKSPEETKRRLFHILAEGKYNPQYWLHFEVPATESLWALDKFIKKMWIDDLDHLSGFTIEGTHYNTDEPTEFFSFSNKKEEEEEEEISAEEMKRIIDEVVEQCTDISPSYLANISVYSNPRVTAWIEEVKKPRSMDDLVDFLKAELPGITKECRAAIRDEGPDRTETRKRYFILKSQQTIAEELLDIFEDSSMGATLQRVLKAGQKFSYTYDFGSSTHINLKVITEREGIVANLEKPVQLLARNVDYAFPCTTCGKPATQVAMGYYTSGIEESALCAECAKKQIDEGRSMPIINSPRVGVL